eukprot:2335220-Alexandrium_andersonii.AAC.1
MTTAAESLSSLFGPPCRLALQPGRRRLRPPRGPRKCRHFQARGGIDQDEIARSKACESTRSLG